MTTIEIEEITEKEEMRYDDTYCHLMDEDEVFLCLYPNMFGQAVDIESYVEHGRHPTDPVCICSRPRCPKCIAAYIALKLFQQHL